MLNANGTYNVANGISNTNCVTSSSSNGVMLTSNGHNNTNGSNDHTTLNG